MRMRRAQQLDVAQALDRYVEGEARLAGDDIGAGRRRHIVADAAAGVAIFGVAFPCDRILDGAIAGAAAQIAFQRTRTIGALRLGERSGGHDHAGCAEAALKALRVEKRLLHRMQFVAGREAFDGGDLAAFGAKRRHQARMHRLAVQIDGAGAAIAGVAALLDAEMAERTQERAQTLSRGGPLGEGLAVDVECHRAAPPSSARISCAKCNVICRRQAGRP